MTPTFDKHRLALGIRQPWAELIVRGVKSLEIRKIDTNVRGRIFVYASRQLSDHPAAQEAARLSQLDLDSLPRGVVVGTIEICDTGPVSREDAAAACLRPEDLDAGHLLGWRLQSPEKYESPVPIRFLPYGIWFYPFRPRGGQGGRG